MVDFHQQDVISHMEASPPVNPDTCELLSSPYNYSYMHVLTCHVPLSTCTSFLPFSISLSVVTINLLLLLAHGTGSESKQNAMEVIREMTHLGLSE